MSDELVCWSCGAGLDDVPVPFSRYAECASCRRELHVCRMCVFYDTSVAKHCREPIAEEVKDKERASFCDYFQARPDAFVAKDSSEADAARAGLAALFGDDAPAAPSIEEPLTPEDKARAELEALFGGKKPE